jgi:hypothetical protein
MSSGLGLGEREALPARTVRGIAWKGMSSHSTHYLTEIRYMALKFFALLLTNFCLLKLTGYYSITEIVNDMKSFPLRL